MVIVSENVFNRRSGTVIAMAITSEAQRARYPLTLEIAAKGLRERSWIKISQIRILSSERIGRRIGLLKEEEMVQVIEGLKEIVGG